jgi:hypothetical protein
MIFFQNLPVEGTVNSMEHGAMSKKIEYIVKLMLKNSISSVHFFTTVSVSDENKDARQLTGRMVD